MLFHPPIVPPTTFIAQTQTPRAAVVQTSDLPTNDQVLSTFLDLVKIPSPSGEEAAVRNYISMRLMAMGLQPVTDKTGNLLVTVPGNQNPSNKTLLINVHMDVVPPCLNIRPVINADTSLPGDNRIVKSSGDTVLGGDDKSAIAPLLEALDYSLKTNQPRPNLLLAITVKEELGAIGAAQIDPTWYQNADAVLSFDINGDQGTVVYQAPQLTLWDATVTGHKAHAGIEPEKGINALKAAAWAAAQIPTGRLDENTTANIGSFNSGEKFNIVPDKAVLGGEVRSFDPNRVTQELDRVRMALESARQQVPGSSSELKLNTVFKTYKTDLNHPALAPLKQALTQTNLPLSAIRTNGGSDANVFAQAGIPSVVLSGAYFNPHQTSEYVRVEDMAVQMRLMLNIWQAYAQGR